jgi:hypothetical protein
MRFMLTTLLACFAGSIWAAEPPALTMQSKPIGELIDDVRAGAKLIGGDALVQRLNDAFKRDKFDKALEGMDTKRSVAGYIFLTGKEDKDNQPPVVIVLPVIKPDVVIASMDSDNIKWEKVKGDEGLFKGTRKDDTKAEYARVVDGAIYALINGDAKLISKDRLIPYEKLVNKSEKAFFTVRFNFARMPEEMRTKAGETIEKALQELKNAPIPAEATAGVKQITEMIQKMTARMLSQLKEANEATFRVQFDSKTGETGLELGLSGLPGSSLAKDIAARSKTSNRFASFSAKDTVVSIVGAAPLLNKEIGNMVATMLDETVKEKKDDLPPPFQPLVEQLSKGFSRTLKSGELDLGLALNGPNDAGSHSLLFGISFDDTSALEKEIKTLIKEMAPPEILQLVKFDAAKVGKSNIHVITPPPGALPPQVTDLFGEKFQLGLAFTPKSIVVAISSDPIGVLKPVVNVEPTAARSLEVAINAARLAKLASMFSPEVGEKITEVLGKKDERYTAFYADLEGGAELKLKAGINIKLIGQAILQGIETTK